MRKVLVINASPRNERSQSRKLTKLFAENWKTAYPEDGILYREVGRENIPHITELWIAGAFKEEQKRTEEERKELALSDELVSELKEADVYVLGVPMYNWSVPSGLKAYIDQILRINETWRFKSGKPDGNYVGLLKDKELFILSSRGDFGYEPGRHNAHWNFQTPYLKLVFKIMGVQKITEISLENEEYGGQAFSESIAKVHRQIDSIFKKELTKEGIS